ncbi:MAG TPA: hypothetical protein VFR37_09660 [Longimicrobium sp.]|nr:hypothetical protein [Longimicrobium sp.]
MSPIPRPVLRALPVLAFVLAGCDSSTSPERRLAVEPGAARSFQMVEVRGVPEAYQTAQPVDVTVGGQPTAILWDALAEVHRMVVPQLAPGEAELVVPRPDGKGELRARLQVLAPQYAGGSPAAALAEMNLLADSLQIQAIVAQRYVSSEADSVLFPRLDALIEIAETTQQRVAALPAQDAAVAAAFYTENAEMMREITGMLTAMIADLASMGPSFSLAGGGGPRLQQTPVSGTRIVQRCVSHVAQLEKLGRLQLWSLGITSALVIAAAAINPIAGAAVAAMTVKFMLALDLTALIAAMVPVILDDDGLRLEVAPVGVLHDGGSGSMRIYAVQQPAGKLLTSAVSLGATLHAAREAMRALIAMREGLRLRPAIWGVLKDFGLVGAIELLERNFGDALREAVGVIHREVPVTSEGVSFTANSAPGRWRFTGAPTAVDRALETVGKNAQAIESVTLAASLGSAQDCRAQTSGSGPANGHNGFQIVTEGNVRFGTPPSATLTAGSQTTLRITVTNEGGQQAQSITYRLATGTGAPWTRPVWLSVSAPSGPATLNPLASGTVSVSVSASSVAPQQSVLIPIQVLVGGKVTASAALSVTIEPQLSDLVVNRQQSTLRLWDHGQQDGDLVTVTLNGTPIASSFSLTNAGTTFPVTYRQGRNVLVVRALNEGSISPNTAALGFANVVRGTATQTYGLSTGGTVQLTITYDPSAQQAARESGAPPAPQLTRCRSAAERDCRP